MLLLARSINGGGGGAGRGRGGTYMMHGRRLTSDLLAPLQHGIEQLEFSPTRQALHQALGGAGCMQGMVFAYPCMRTIPRLTVRYRAGRAATIRE